MTHSPRRRWRRLVASAALAIVAATAAVVPNRTTAAADTAEDYASAYAYVETFFPLWFTYNQSLVEPHNQFIGPDKVTPAYQGVVAINVDTVYASTMIDVSAEPVIVTVPEAGIAFSVLHLDPFGNVFDGIASHAEGTTQPETVYALTAPGYSGALPAGATEVSMPYDFSVLILRADRHSGSGQDQTDAATAFRADLKVQALAAYEADPSGGATTILPGAEFSLPVKSIADDLIADAPKAFLEDLQEAVQSTNTPPLNAADQAVADEFDARFAAASDDSPFERATRDVHEALVANYLDNVGSTNWVHFTDIAAWGDAYLDRASITEYIQFGNSISTAAYYQAFSDGEGVALDGRNQDGYVLTFAPGTLPEAERFWSLTAYTPQAIELIPNAIDKYAVGGYTEGLQYEDDGTLNIYLSANQPDDVPTANWLPVSDRPFNVMLRVYGVVSGSSVADGTYEPPAIVAYEPTPIAPVEPIDPAQAVPARPVTGSPRYTG